MNNVLMAVLAGAIGVLGISLSTNAGPERSTTSPSIFAVETRESRAAADENRTVRLRIEGMTCGGCAISVRVVLERLDGVEKADVRYDEKLAIVIYDAEKVTPERMIKTLEEKLRYKATVIERSTR